MDRTFSYRVMFFILFLFIFIFFPETFGVQVTGPTRISQRPVDGYSNKRVSIRTSIARERILSGKK